MQGDLSLPSPHDRLALCTALQRLSTFAPAELALRARRKLRLTLRFLRSAPHLVQVKYPRGHDRARPRREFWTVVSDRAVLYREIELLRDQCNALPEVGDLFEGVDRVLRDVQASEAALRHQPTPEATQSEGGWLAAQRVGIDHALLDIEVAVAGAVHARRKANDTYGRMERVADGEAWLKEVGPVLLDWSSAAVGIAPDDAAVSAAASGAASPYQVASQLRWLARQDPLDLGALRHAVTELRNLRAAWAGAEPFGELLSAEFQQLLRQPHGRRWLRPLAVTAAALSETACAHALFEGWVMQQGSRRTADEAFPVVASVLARFAFESHVESGRRWSGNPAASMCQYLLSGRLTPMETLLASTGSMLGVTSNVEHTMKLIAQSFSDLRPSDASNWVTPLSRSVWIALFLQTGRPLLSIPSFAELPGPGGLFATLVNLEHEAVLYRLVPPPEAEGLRRERYELRPGAKIEAALARCFGDADVRLNMPTSDEYERRSAAETASDRWRLAPAPPTSFMGELEAAASVIH